MGRFIRDFALIACIVLLSLGLYGLYVGMETRGPDTSLYLLGGAALSAATLVRGCKRHPGLRDA